METMLRRSTNPCIICGEYFDLPRKRGRPPHRCVDCRIEDSFPSFEPSDVNDSSHGYGRPAKVAKPNKAHRFDNDPKRGHQSICHKAIKEVYGLGTEKIPSPYSIVSLCDDQTGDDTQYRLILDELVEGPSQYIGVCDNGIKIRDNETMYPEATWICGNLVSNDTMKQMRERNVLVVDADFEGSLKNERDIETLSILLNNLERDETIMANFLVELARKKMVHDPVDTLDLLRKVPGFDGWYPYRCLAFGDSWFRDYKSKGQESYRYRTVLLRRK